MSGGENGFAQVRAIFDRAAEMGGSERRAFLDEACAGDEGLRGEVESLLRHHDVTSGALDTPLVETSLLSREARLEGAGLEAPERIDGYRILELLGTGGMGAVYLAEQETPRRLVAIKLLRAGLASPELLARFARESEILGRLRHPGIAQVIQSGRFSWGPGGGVQPYFAMEYIEGEPLYTWAARRELSTRARLELVAKVCDAIDHAHQNGVTHRDLKPGNILVERDGQPRILDFGVAALTDADVQITTVQTDAGQLLGTLPYMSPEQVRGEVRRIEPRTDIYAIGVLAYELLAGHKPYNLANRSLPEASRIICEEEPESLSRVSRSFRGDIETICRKALEKDPSRRYATAAEMALDIRRHLEAKPIHARPPGHAYKLGKFARRHRALVGGVAAAFLILVIGIISTAWYAVQLGEAREAERLRADEASRQVEKAGAINDFLTRMLASANPDTALGREMSVRDVLEDAARRLEYGALAKEPDVQAAVRTTLGLTFQALGDYVEAGVHLEAARVVMEEVHGGDSLAYAESLERLGALQTQMNDYAGAEALFEEALAIRRAAPSADDDPVLAWPWDLLSLYYHTGRYAEAAEMHRRAAASLRAAGVSAEEDLGLALSGLAVNLEALGELDEAIAAHRESLALQERVHGPINSEVAATYNNLANVLEASERYEEAEQAHRRALEIRERLFDEDHPVVANSMSNLALVLARHGDPAEAERLLRRALELRRHTLPEVHSSNAATWSVLGLALTKQGRLEEAYEVMQEAYRVATLAVPEGHLMPPVLLGNWGDCASRLGRWEEAEAKLLEAHERVSALVPAENLRARRITGYLHDHYERAGRPEEAARWAPMQEVEE